MVGQRASKREVFLRRGSAENGLGELSVTLVASGGELRVDAAAAGVGMSQRGHVPGISKWRVPT